MTDTQSCVDTTTIKVLNIEMGYWSTKSLEMWWIEGWFKYNKVSWLKWVSPWENKAEPEGGQNKWLRGKREVKGEESGEGGRACENGRRVLRVEVVDAVEGNTWSSYHPICFFQSPLFIYLFFWSPTGKDTALNHLFFILIV